MTTKTRLLLLPALALAFACAEEADQPTEDAGASSTPDASTPPVAGDIPAPEDVAAAPSDATKTETGLAYKVLKKGTGATKPRLHDAVQVHYSGWTQDGKMFDSSVKRGRPASFPLKGVIPGWTEGLQYMVEGEKTRFWIPGDLAYGDTPRRPGAPAGQLTFDVELISIQPGPEPIPAPDDVAKAPANAKKTASGLQYKVLQKGTGKLKPVEDDRIEVHYTGWATDGTMLQTTTNRNRPATMVVKQSRIKGWIEGLQLMTEGEKTRFWIPQELAYGDRPPMPGIKPGPVTFDFELAKVYQAPKPIAAPKDVAAAPKDAKRTDTGLAYKVIKKGKGKAHPAATQRVEVHYTGWTTDGKMFDSSVQRGQPATFALNRVIKGWTEGVQLMVEGEKTRFWIPGKLAYGDTPSRPGAPAGQLTFDVELIKIHQ